MLANESGMCLFRVISVFRLFETQLLSRQLSAARCQASKLRPRIAIATQFYVLNRNNSFQVRSVLM